jgi:hypothetical protein
LTDVRIATVVTVVLLAALLGAAPATAGQPVSTTDRVEELQQELDALREDVEDLREPVEEFELFDECMYLVGVTEHGRAGGREGYLFEGARRTMRPALALDVRGFGLPMYQFLAFPAEEPPSIECNEDVGEEDADD